MRIVEFRATFLILLYFVMVYSSVSLILFKYKRNKGTHALYVLLGDAIFVIPCNILQWIK